MRKQNFFLQHIENNVFKYILSAILFLVGAFVGAAALNRIDVEQCKELVEYFSSSDKNVEFVYMFKKSTVSNLKWLGAYFIMSLSMYTSWLGMLLIGVKGFCAGFTSAFLITNYASKGIVYVLLAIIPQTIITIPFYAFLSATCVNFATAYKKGGRRGEISRFSIVPALAVMFFIMMVCSLYDVIVAPFMLKRLFG